MQYIGIILKCCDDARAAPVRCRWPFEVVSYDVIGPAMMVAAEDLPDCLGVTVMQSVGLLLLTSCSVCYLLFLAGRLWLCTSCLSVCREREREKEIPARM